MTWLLIKLLEKALQFADAKQKKYVAHALIAYVVDVFVARTTFAAIAGQPKGGEVTISHMLERLAHPSNSQHQDYLLFVELAKYINRKSPTRTHIEAVL